VLGVCVKSQAQIDAWSEQSEAALEEADAMYADGVMACDQLGQDAQAGADALAQAALANATSVLDLDLAAVSAAKTALTALTNANKYAPAVVAAVAQAGNAMSNLAALAPISSPTLYLDVNLAVLTGAQNATAAALAAAEEVALAAGAAPEQLTALGTALAAVNVAAAAELAFAEAVQAVAQAAATDACLAAIDLATAPYYAEAAYYELLAEDPPDPNYTVIATPVVPSLSGQPLTPATGFSPQVVNDLNALIVNAEQEIALLQVIPTSVNRVAGAAAAGSTVWQKKQAQAVQQYAAELIPLVQNEISLRASLVSDLEASGVVFTFTSNEVFNLLGPVLQNGLPAAVVTALTQLGVDAKTQALITQTVASADPTIVAGLGSGSFPQALSDPSLNSAANATIGALTTLAAVPPASSLTQSLSISIPGDYTAAGVGLRGRTTGNITISAVPAGATVQKAFLYWGMLDNGLDATLPQMTLNGNAITGTLIGTGPDTCWGRTNSYTFRADVTPFVQGNGTYVLNGVAIGGNILAEGASLVVIYQLPGSPTKTVMLSDGNLSMPLGTATGTATFTGFTASAPVAATTTFMVGDGQGAQFNIQTPTSFTGNLGTINFPNLFNSLNGLYWDTSSFDVSPVVGAGNASDTAKIQIAGDCLLWSAQAFSVTTAPVVSAPVTATAAVVQANANGDTVVNLRGLMPTDAPTLQQQIQMIVQSRTIQNPSTSTTQLTTQLVNSLPPSILPPSQAAGLINAIVGQIVLPTPKIVWPSPASITYGTPLSATQLDATASVPGTFVYTPAAGTVLQAGNGQTLSVVFTPTDTANFKVATTTTTLNVTKATPTITWPAPAAIPFGSALGSGQLDATANIPGVFVYAPAAGTVLPAGNGQTLSAFFTPSDTTDYNPAKAATAISVTPAAPSPAPAKLVVTQVLSRSGGNVNIQFTVANSGGAAAANVTLTSVKVGADAATPLPQNVGTIPSGGETQATVTVPASVGASGAASSITLSGTYTGGTLSYTARITLP
jgi:hypothetical protein